MKILMSKSEVDKALPEFKAKLGQVLKEFSMFYRVQDLKVVPRVVSYPMGYDIEADLYVGGELVEHYCFADLVLLDLNDLMLQRMLKG